MLPEAQMEIEEIGAIYGRDRLVSEPITGSNATEKAFWRLATDPKGRAGVLHVSCHGATEPGEPMNSGLYLSDAKVDAGEIASSGFTWKEVVLSACCTGYRPTAVGDVDLVADDVLGMPGALLEAGAHSIVLAIPRIGDRVAREFTVRYHRERLSRASPLMAFRATQTALLTEGRFQPGEWAGFVLYGCR
jgi:CHAT domain-containing protein